jgi:two-component system nitrate/nitrite response regulator NarL
MIVEDLLAEGRLIALTELWLDRAATARVLSRMTSGDGDVERRKIETLTTREQEILALVAQGLRNKEIAEGLFISEVTVRHHLTSIFGKLEVNDRLALVMYAFRHGLAEPPRR